MSVEQWPGFWSAMRASTSASETEAPRPRNSSQRTPSPGPRRCRVDARGDIYAPDDTRDELGQVAADLEDLVELLLAVHDHDAGVGVLEDVLARVGLVGGVDARRETARGYGAHVGEVPLRGVEAEDGDGLEAAEAEVHE